MKSNHFNTIVVGGGIAGLTSAVYLARAGKKVLLIEKNSRCGGLVNTFYRDGYYFEAGVRALEDAGIIFPMLKDLGIDLEVVKSRVSLGIEGDIIDINDVNSLKDYKNLLINKYPNSRDEIENFLKIVRKIIKHMDVLYGIENPLFKDLKHDKQYLLKKILPWFPKFILTIGKINKMNLPVEPYLEKIISDKSLRDIISQHFFKSTPAFFALSYFSLYIDYFYPKGGVGRLTDAIQNRVGEYGGEILTQTTIKSIDAHSQQITDNKGNIYQYDNLIWAADLKTFYNNTSTKGLSTKIVDKFNSTKEQICSCRGSDTVFSLYLEIDEPCETFAKIANGHLFYTPSKKGMGDIYRDKLSALLKDWNNLKKSDILLWLTEYVNFNTYEISIPALKDRSLAPDNKTGMIISILAEYDLFAKVKDDGWYNEFKTELENRMIDVLTESLYPMLKDRIIKQFSFSPVSIKKYIGSSEGAIVGWSFQDKIPVVHKLQYSDKSVITPIPNIYQAGQWVYSPTGVPMCILTGKLAANRVLRG